MFDVLGDLDSKEEVSGLTEEERAKREDLKIKLTKLMCKDEVSWK